VVFYDVDNQKKILLKGEHTPIVFEEGKIAADERATIFDPAHTYAANVPQGILAEAVVTIGEDTTCQGFYQAVWRMRELHKKQNIKIVFTKSVQKMMGEGLLSIEEVQKFVIKNEARILGPSHYQADLQKISDIVLQAVIDKMIFAPSVDDLLKIGTEFVDLLKTAEEVSPFKLFGYPDIFVKPIVVLEQLKKVHLERIRKSKMFTAQEIEDISLQMASIGSNIYPDTVHSYQKNTQNPLHSMHVLGQTQESAQNEEDWQELDLQNTREITSFYPREKTTVKLAKPTNWDRSTSAENLDWLEFTSSKTLPLYQMQKVLDSLENRILKKISSFFHPHLWCSNNFITRKAIGWGFSSFGITLTEPGGEYQQPLMELLVTQEILPNQQIKIHVGAIDDFDVQFWRKKLKENRALPTQVSPNLKIGIYNIGLGAFVAETKSPFDSTIFEDPSFFEQVTQWKFFAGRVKYTKKEQEYLEKWIQSAGVYDMEEAFEYIYQHHKTAEYIGSPLHTLFTKLAVVVPFRTAVRFDIE